MKGIQKMPRLLIFAFAILMVNARVSVNNGKNDRISMAGHCSSFYAEVKLDANGETTFGSPGSKYANDMDCGWSFSTDASYDLSLECTRMHIIESDFFNMEDKINNLTTRVTNVKLTKYSKSFDSNKVAIGLVTDSSRTGSGFQCAIKSEFSARARTATQPSIINSCTCGVNDLKTRIVGGSRADQNMYPFVVGLKYSRYSMFPFCGGSIINSNFIMTAAHCSRLEYPYISLGMHDVSKFSDYETVQALERIKHESYNTDTFDYDIALYRIPTVKFTDKIRSVCLPDTSTGDNNYIGRTATVIGWGKTLSNQDNKVILEVDVPILSNEDCQKSYGMITDRMICAGFDEGEKDACQGDSGGPLFVNETGAFEQIGIVSSGYGCALARYPGVYARVTELMPWIVKYAGSFCARP